MKISEEFCGQKNGYSRSITLRNRLIPVGKTEENFIDSLQTVQAEKANAKFFDSREQLALGKKAKLQIDADANGAYHIALKGLYLFLYRKKNIKIRSCQCQKTHR